MNTMIHMVELEAINGYLIIAAIIVNIIDKTIKLILSTCLT